MKELVGTAVNFALAEGAKDGFVGTAEIIMVLSEPQYHVDMSGQMNRSRSIEQFRFAASVKGLRSFAKSFNEYADALAALEKRVLKPSHEP